jgi:hypothetical protein
MKVYNVRFGLATNSSSSHSIIFLDERVNDTDIAGNEFGWQFFTAQSEESKRNYLAVLLGNALKYSDLPDNIVRLITREWVGVENAGDWDDGHVDHQSALSMPRSVGPDPFVSEEFFKELRNFFLQQDVTILGGNDNTEEEHRLLERGRPVNLPLPRESGEWVCRKDELYNYWSLFNQRNGTKIRFRFEENGQVEPEKAFAPELVDIKITDFCPLDCKFCYQDSTLRGKHADDQFVYSLTEALKDIGVFEVALGGGEPTLYPQFARVLQKFKNANIIPNFTTRNLHWLREPSHYIPIIQNCGSFAYSVSRAQDVKRLAALLETNGIQTDKKAAIHIVMGTITKWEYRSILREASTAGFPVTLLGFKDVGRGHDYRRRQDGGRRGHNQFEDYGWWLADIRELREERACPTIAIDTALAAEYEQQILAADIPNYLFHTQEGKFSCYIDAVNKTMGPSSYCNENEMRILDRHIDDSFLNIYQEF